MTREVTREMTWDALDDALTQRTGSAPEAVEAAKSVAESVANIRASLSSAGEAPPDMQVALHSLFARLARRPDALRGSGTRGGGLRNDRGLARGSVRRQTSRRATWSFGAIGAMILAVLAIRTHLPLIGGTTRTYGTLTGQQATFTLSDGTEVTLEPRTTLRLTQFGLSSRTVELDGQAYFNVKHWGTTPFAVHSNGVTIRVLGTAFMVRHYPEDPQVHVAVAEGKVNLVSPSLRRAGWTLTAGDVGNVMDSTVQIGTIDDLASHGVWRNGEFEFRDTRVSKILETLTWWYGYHFRYADSTLVQQTVTAAISARSPSSALAVLEQVLEVNLSAVGDTITLIPQARKPLGAPRNRRYDSWTPNREVGR